MAFDKKKAWKWTKRAALWGTVALVVREGYLAFGPRRERRRTVFELAQRRAEETGKPLLVLGDPDGGLINHLLGRAWQCGELCVDPSGCGTCAEWMQGRPEDVLAELPDNGYVIYDPGAFGKADDGVRMAKHMARVSGGDVYIADAGPYTLAAYLEPRRKRRILAEPQVNQGVVEWKPLLWQPEPQTGRDAMALPLRGLPR